MTRLVIACSIWAASTFARTGLLAVSTTTSTFDFFASVERRLAARSVSSRSSASARFGVRRRAKSSSWRTISVTRSACAAMILQLSGASSFGTSPDAIILARIAITASGVPELVRDARGERADGAQSVGVPQLLERGETLRAFVVGARSRVAKLIAHRVQLVDERGHFVGAFRRAVDARDRLRRCVVPARRPRASGRDTIHDVRHDARGTSRTRRRPWMRRAARGPRSRRRASARRADATARVPRGADPSASSGRYA